MGKFRKFLRTKFFPNLITFVIIGTTVSFSSLAAYKLSQHAPPINKILNNANSQQVNAADGQNNSAPANIESSNQQNQNSNSDTQKKAKISVASLKGNETENLSSNAASSGNNTENTILNDIPKRNDGDNNGSLEDNRNSTNNSQSRQLEEND